MLNKKSVILRQKVFTKTINIVYNCGLVVQKCVHKIWISTSFNPHFTHGSLFLVKINKLYTFYSTNNKQLLHNLFIQNLSVNNMFYTLYTAPTITTIYINNRKEL